jgi:hypothetical protein
VRRWALGNAVVVSAVTFALIHLINAGSPTAVFVIGLSTFGLGAGALAAVTDRLGGAIVAHVVFNAMVVLPVTLGLRALPGGNGQFGSLAGDKLAGGEAYDAALLSIALVVPLGGVDAGASAPRT